MRPQENIAKIFIAPDIVVKSFDHMGNFSNIFDKKDTVGELKDLTLHRACGIKLP